MKQMRVNLLGENSQWKDRFQKGFLTERLILKPLLEKELKTVFEISDDSDLFHYVADLNDADDLKTWLNAVFQKRHFLFYAIRIRATLYGRDEFSGVLMLEKKNDDEIEVGGWLGKKFHKKGFGKEIVTGLFQFFQKVAPEIRLYAEVREDHAQVMKLLSGTGIDIVKTTADE